MKNNFFGEMGSRFKKQRTSAFYGYFILIVIIFAGLGVVFSFYNALKSPQDDGIVVAQNLATYFIAILATSIIDMNISWEIENRVSLFIYSIILLVLGVFILFCTYTIKTDFAFVPAIIGSILAWLTWILANADNEKLSDENFYNCMRGKGKHGKNWNEE